MKTRQKTDFYERFMAEAAVRRSRALEFHRAGKTYEEIAAAFGISKQRAWDMVQRAKADAGDGLPNP
jgi:transposase